MLLNPEDLPVSDEDRLILRRLRQFSPQEIFAGIQALVDAYPRLEAQARTRPTFAGRTPFVLPSPRPTHLAHPPSAEG